MTAHAVAVYTGYSRDLGCDLLLTEYSDGHREIATRSGHDQRWDPWSPPVALKAEERMPEDRRHA